MRKLILLVFLIVILSFIQPVFAAKSVVYVTRAPTDTSCAGLETVSGTQDKLYCSRLQTLGYTVKVVNELLVRDNQEPWPTYADAATLIFLGNVSKSMVNTSEDAGAFCGNVKTKFFATPRKGLLSTFYDTWNNTTGKIMGCSFQLGNYYQWPYTDNQCNKKTFRILSNNSYHTEDFNSDQNYDLYTTAHTVKLLGKVNPGEVGVEYLPADCPTFDAEAGFYPVIDYYAIDYYPYSKVAFWGLDNPSDFSSNAWTMFDKIIASVIGDDNWNITPIIYPTVATKNSPIWIIANISEGPRIVSNNLATAVYFTDGVTNGNLSFENNLWKNLTVNFDTLGLKNLQFSTYSKSGLRNSTTKGLYVGNWSVEIVPDSYSPGSDFIIFARFWSGTDPVILTGASYNIVNLTDYSIIETGSLGCSNNECSVVKTNMPDWGDFSLVVFSMGSGTSSGGSIKTITKGAPPSTATLTTDKDVYHPGDIMRIYLTTEKVTNAANLTIYRPDITVNIGSMTKINNTYYNKNYTLGAGDPSGNYILNVKYDGSEINKTVSVDAWDYIVNLNKNNFKKGDTLNITVITSNVTSPSLNFTIKATAFDSLGNATNVGTGRTIGNNTTSITWNIPSSISTGFYNLTIFLNDSYNRNSTTNMSFTVTQNATTGIVLYPSLFSIVTATDKTISKSFLIQNLGNSEITVDDVNISSDLSDIIAITSQPSSIPATSNGTVSFTISTLNLDTVTYTGEMLVDTTGGNATLDLSIDVVGDLAAEADDRIAELQSLLPNITDLQRKGKNTTTVKNLYNNTLDLLDQVKTEHNNENYEDARNDLDTAVSNIASVRSQITALATAKTESRLGTIIWIVAIVVIVVIVGFTAYVYRDKIRGLFRKKQPTQEEQQQYYYPQYGEEGYRTEYY
jgi:hypothetical protein